MMKKRIMTAGLVALALGACGPQVKQTTDTRVVAQASLPAALFATEAPEGAQAITAAKGAAAVGDEVTVHGRVGGSHDPFVTGRAVMTVADPDAITACDQAEGDACQAPWDFCCEPPEKIAAALVTVQVVGADGRPLKAELNGSGGLAPGAFVVVHGKVAQKADGGVFVVDADSIHVVP